MKDGAAGPVDCAFVGAELGFEPGLAELRGFLFFNFPTVNQPWIDDTEEAGDAGGRVVMGGRGGALTH